MVEADRIVSCDQELGRLVVSLGMRSAASSSRVRWFARDLATLSCVTDVLMPPVRADASDAELRRPSHVIIPADYLKILGSMEDRTYEILNASAAKVFGNDTVVNNGNIGDFVSSNVPSIGKFMTDLSAVEASSSCVPSLSAISRVMRVLQWHVAFLSEFKTNHAEWVNIVKPNLGPGIRERVTEFKSALATLLKKDGILAIPTVHGATPKLGMDAALLEDFRARAFSLLSIAGMPGFCQASIPLGTCCGIPVPFLVAIARELQEAFQDEAATAWSSSARSYIVGWREYKAKYFTQYNNTHYALQRREVIDLFISSDFRVNLIVDSPARKIWTGHIYLLNRELDRLVLLGTGCGVGDG
uniref:Uncharacterized protein n=1 Tax=Aegilops tauschii TaxID=37682 RepID=M8CL43_AEGTA